MQTSTPRLIFTLAVLIAINTMNFFDRQILPAVQEKIRVEWQLGDRDLGLLGSAFIILYAIVGLPLGFLVDRTRRTVILAIGVVLWSLFTLGSGAATGFAMLVVMRLGVGVGEASCAPVASSLIGDLVPARWRARTMSLFMLGLPVGLALSFLVSSSIANAENYGWRWAFYIAGVPGLLLGIAALFIADPSRGALSAPSYPLKTSLGRILTPTFLLIIVSGALHNFNMYAMMSFLTSLLVRYHETDMKTAGQMSALVCGVGALGITVAGWLGDFAFRYGPRWRLVVAWIGIAVAVPCIYLALEVPPRNLVLCTAWLFPGYFLLYAYYGTVYATIQDIVEPSLRGIGMAVYFCGMYFLGGVLGPYATGWLSDTLARRAATLAGSEAIQDIHKAVGLHDAMYLIPAVNIGLVLILLFASLTVTRDYRRLHGERAEK